MRRLLWIAMCIMLGVFAPARGQQVPTREMHDELFAFGNWRIDHLSTNDTYKLVGSSTGKSPGHFYLQCGPDHFFAVGVPLFKTDPKSYAKSVTVTVWSAGGKPRDIVLIAVNYALATSINYKGQTHPEVDQFADTLFSATKFFAMSYEGVTYEFDLTHFPAARTRFMELCDRFDRIN